MTCEINQEVYISYVYGELDVAQKEILEKHLQTCNDCQSEISELKQTRGILGKWEDIDPPFKLTFVAETNQGKNWRHRFADFIFKPVTAWALPAAVILLLMLFNTRLVYQEGRLAVYFGNAQPETNQTDLVHASQMQSMQVETLQMVQQMIQASEVRQEQQTAGQMRRFAELVENRRQRDLLLVGQGLEGLHVNTLTQYQQTNALLSDLIHMTNYQDTLQ